MAQTKSAFSTLTHHVSATRVEEPVSADDKGGQAEVRAATDIPIASGESEFTRFDFRDLIELRAVDVLQPDLSIAGGITEGMRIEALASAHQLRFAPHLWGGALTFAAGLHVAAVASSGFILEYSLGANPMLHELALEGFPVAGGMVEIRIVPASGSRSTSASSSAIGCRSRRRHDPGGASRVRERVLARVGHRRSSSISTISA
jgi:hypothetical protein